MGREQASGIRLLGVVLAGGQSRRFGSDKAVAVLGGQALIDRSIDSLACHVEAIVISGRAWAGVESIQDRPENGLGPLGGLNAGLHHAFANGFGAVVTTGCDMPAFGAETVRRLIAAGGPAIVAGQHLAGYWPVTLAARLDAYLRRTADRSLAAWIREAGATAVEIDEPMPNINTAADLAALARDPDWLEPR